VDEVQLDGSLYSPESEVQVPGAEVGGAGFSEKKKINEVATRIFSFLQSCFQNSLFLQSLFFSLFHNLPSSTCLGKHAAYELKTRKLWRIENMKFFMADSNYKLALFEMH